MGRTYIGYGYTNSEGVATLDYDANGNQLPKKSYACHSRNTSVVAEASIDNVITASNSIRFCENYVPPSETLSLTADKSVLSYADSDSCTLTATYDGSDVSGKSVVFKVGSTVLATETTDSNGVATYEYESQGVGDVTITAECMNLQETYVIEDCKYFNNGSSVGSLPIGGSVSCTSNGDYLTISTSTSGEKGVWIPVTLSQNDEWVFETEVAEVGVTQSLAVYLNDGNWWGGISDTQNRIFSYFGSNSEITMPSNIKGGVYKVVRQNNKTTAYWNDTVIGSTINTHKSSFKVGYYTNANRTQHIKNIKLKPL